jgi:glycosyltransferase involved in cell wall biosynthesis
MRTYGDRVRYFRQKNGGAGSARNFAMREARGDYLAFLDSDDVWTLDKIEVQAAFIEQHPEVDFVFGDMSIFSASSQNELEPEIKNEEIHAYFVEHSTHLRNLFDCLIVENMVPMPTVLLRRSCLADVGYFAEDLKIAEDLDLWLRIAARCHCAFINKVILLRRRHETNLINDWARMSLYHAKVLERALKIHALSGEAEKKISKKLKSLYYDLGSHYFKKRRFLESYFYLRMSGPRRERDWQYSIKFSVLSPFYARRNIAAPQFT